LAGASQGYVAMTVRVFFIPAFVFGGATLQFNFVAQHFFGC